MLRLPGQRKKSFMVAVNGNESEFVTELDNRYADDLKREYFTCPRCGGRLEKKKGPYGDFLGCSNYKINECGFKRKLRAR